MYFVTQLLPCGHKTHTEHNLRIGGYKEWNKAVAAVKSCCSPCLVRDETRKIIDQTVDPAYPNWISK